MLLNPEGAIIFFGREVPNFPKVGINKTVTPLFPSRYTLPRKQAKIVLKSIFLNKINTLSVVILWRPTFWLSKILWPPLFFLSKKLWLPPCIYGTPIPKKMIAPLALVILLAFTFDLCPVKLVGSECDHLFQTPSVVHKCSCVCAVTKFLPAKNFCQLLRVKKNSNAQLHFHDDHQRAF